MIVEAVVSTGPPPNFAPMGVVFDKKTILVRPFRTSDTYRNLVATRCGVVNVTDNVLIIARAALSDCQFSHCKASVVSGYVLEDVCRWHEFTVDNISGDDERADVRCTIVSEGRKGDFSGFNRGKNAVIEATILATRLSLYDASFVIDEMERYRTIVEKTGGCQEREAMAFLLDYCGVRP